MKNKKRIAILTGGGDCPGLNAVIRAVAKKAILEYGMEVIGIEDGYDGLIQNKHRKLSYDDVSGILTMGGTILGTSNTANPYRYAVKKGQTLEFSDMSKTVIRNIKKLNVCCLVCIGGDGTLWIASRLNSDGVPVVGVPKTIDNDILCTDITFGFDTAVAIATEGVDRLHTTAQSHHRIMTVEVMGRNAGWIALHSGIAGGGDVILIPEISYDIDIIAEYIRQRNKRGRRFSIVVISEGAKPKGGDVVIQRIVKESTDPVRLGGVGFVFADKIAKLTGMEARTVVMGHLLRGGSPTAFDRVLATSFGAKTAELIAKGDFGNMVAVRGTELVKVPLSKVAKGIRTIPRDHQLIQTAKSVGVCFGDR